MPKYIPLLARTLGFLALVSSIGSAQQIVDWPDYLASPGTYDVTTPELKGQFDDDIVFQVSDQWTPDYSFRYGSSGFVPNDPYVPINSPDVGLPGTWHLQNNTAVDPSTDVHIQGAWDRGLVGSGVTIGIVDDSLQHTHPDLSPNYVAGDSFDFGQNDADPSPVFAGDRHGTAVAGVAAARGGNALGATGSAPLAKLAGLRIDFQNQRQEMFVDATLFHSDGVGPDGSNIQIKNHSYGNFTSIRSQPDSGECDADLPQQPARSTYSQQETSVARTA